MNLVEVKRISYYPPSKGYAVHLNEKDGDRSIHVIVGTAEAQAIALYLEDVKMPRPMTHDLFVNLLENFKSSINRIIISRITNGTYFAEIEVSSVNFGKIIIDSRPSDAIAIAIRTLTPIFISDEVMNALGTKNSFKSDLSEPIVSNDFSENG